MPPFWKTCLSPRPAAPFRTVPWLEALEDRQVPSLFAPPLNVNGISGTNGVAVADFNGDGKPDLAVSNYSSLADKNGSSSIGILLGYGDGTFQKEVTYTTGPHPYGIAVGDLNGDGHPDLVVANRDPFNYDPSISVLLGNGDGTFQNAVNDQTDGGGLSVALGDFNGDGNLDIAVGTEFGKVSILLGNGNGTFQNAQSMLGAPMWQWGISMATATWTWPSVA
jgi:hypothetical protein